MNAKLFLKGFRLEWTDAHVLLAFETPRPVLSSAVLNGGWVRADAILNLRVPKHTQAPDEPLDPPEKTLSRYCRNLGWDGKTVGMMTAASLNSLRTARELIHGFEIGVMVTSGLSNPLRAGDPSGFPTTESTAYAAGTINTLIATSASLYPEAMVEAIVIATEAKAAALQAQAVKSRVSSAIATGTGTDAIAFTGGDGPPAVRYCGKHTLFGEVLARLVIQATRASLSWESPGGLTA